MLPVLDLQPIPFPGVLVHRFLWVELPPEKLTV
jgi:hypothetical protein